MTDNATHQTKTTFEQDEERIREVAYHLWLAEGMPEGKADQHWDAAKEIVATRDNLETTLVPLEQSRTDVPELPTLAEVHGDMPGLTDQVDSEQPPRREKETGRASAPVTANSGRRRSPTPS